MTSMSQAVETQFNVTAVVLYNENETHKLNGDVWKMLGHRRDMFRVDHTGEHIIGGVKLK